MVVTVVVLKENNAIGSVDDQEIGGIFGELSQTRLFKSKRTHAEIGAAVAGLHHLLGSELVGFWTYSSRNEGVDLEFVANDALHKVTQRFDAHRDNGAIADHVTARA